MRASMFSRVTRYAAVLAALVLSAQAFGQARVLIVHAAPFADSIEGTSVSVTVNGDAVLEDFRFKDFTDFIELPAGEYDLAVIPTGATDPAMTATVELEDGTDYTVFATGDGVNQDLALWPVVDDATDPGTDNLNIRVVHAAPFAAESADTEVSIRTASGDVVNGLVGVPYFVQSGFFAIPAGNYDLKVASPDGSVNLIDPLPVDLPAGLDVTVVAIGDGVNQPLGILAIPVGELETRAPVDFSANGWWKPLNSFNEGLILQTIPAQNRLVGTVNTYGSDGNARWYIFDGPFDGRVASATVFRAEDGEFGGQFPATVSEAGSIEIEVLDCQSGTASIDLDTGESFTWELSRLVHGLPCTLD